MHKYYEVRVKQTSKPIGGKEGYSIFNSTTEYFGDLKEVKAYLTTTYGKCKRSKMFNDGITGEPKHVGYVYHFKNSDISHNSEAWYQQDWVEVKEIKATTVIV